MVRMPVFKTGQVGSIPTRGIKFHLFKFLITFSAFSRRITSSLGTLTTVLTKLLKASEGDSLFWLSFSFSCIWSPLWRVKRYLHHRRFAYQFIISETFSGNHFQNTFETLRIRCFPIVEYAVLFKLQLGSVPVKRARQPFLARISRKDLEENCPGRRDPADCVHAVTDFPTRSECF